MATLIQSGSRSISRGMSHRFHASEPRNLQTAWKRGQANGAFFRWKHTRSLKCRWLLVGQGVIPDFPATRVEVVHACLLVQPVPGWQGRAEQIGPESLRNCGRYSLIGSKRPPQK